MTSQTANTAKTSGHKAAVLANAEKMAPARDGWIARNSGYYDSDIHYMKFLISEGMRVIDLGCGTGSLLSALKPSRGVGVDFSPGMIAQARSRNHGLEFVEADIEDEAALKAIAGPFDYVVISDTVGMVDDMSRHFETCIIFALRKHAW